eukprot:CAMPEP_0172800096 /NCGR_PEP_ID=MMETSP1075-20121228/2337_1 /TAXON_ID=2916 /ORGANISM="Ceratium fusus, Strain PA161109" /LENGTH=81 /DNA_ID=CAMNT_0013637917 /DNA_START=41 /DNA_END=283 /DNA_ORIENTATION=+
MTDVDMELPPRQHPEMMSDPQHEASNVSSSRHESVPLTKDKLYSKLLCLIVAVVIPWGKSFVAPTTSSFALSAKKIVDWAA